MRLLNVNTLELESFSNVELQPTYAILSHTWGTEEVLFQDWKPRDQDAIKGLQDQLDALTHKLNLVSTVDLTMTDIHEVSPNSPELFWQKPHILKAKQKCGWRKIDYCCAEARRWGIQYVWIDTLCIDNSV